MRIILPAGRSSRGKRSGKRNKPMIIMTTISEEEAYPEDDEDISFCED